MKSKSMEEHKQSSPKSVNFAVITLSDSKYRDYLENKTTDIGIVITSWHEVGR
jgi:molybdenum cofactor biosynthesis protein B